MRFSIVIPSYLGEYPTAARARDKKIIRAVDSCMGQRYDRSRFEIIVVADGCESTFHMMRGANYENVTCILIQKQPMFSGNVRNAGLRRAVGEYIVYLDIDDKLGPDHLQLIQNGIMSLTHKTGAQPDWVYFNDYVYRDTIWNERKCNVSQYGHHGTANICHRGDLGILWNSTGYAKEDYYFIRGLKERAPNYFKINTPEYYVCHIPGMYDI